MKLENGILLITVSEGIMRITLREREKRRRRRSTTR